MAQLIPLLNSCAKFIASRIFCKVNSLKWSQWSRHRILNSLHFTFTKMIDHFSVRLLYSNCPLKWDRRRFSKVQKSPLRWDSSQKKIWKWDISEEICRKNGWKQSKQKRKREGEEEKRGNEWKIRIFYWFPKKNTLFLLSGTGIFRGPKNSLKWDTHLSGTKRVFKEQIT